MNEWTLLSLVVRFSDFRSDCEDVSCIYFAFPQDLDESVCHKPMPARQIPAARMTDVSCQLQYLFKMFTVCWYKAPRGRISDSGPFSFDVITQNVLSNYWMWMDLQNNFPDFSRAVQISYHSREHRFVEMLILCAVYTEIFCHARIPMEPCLPISKLERLIVLLLHNLAGC